MIIELGIIILVLIISWAIGSHMLSNPEAIPSRQPWQEHMEYFEGEQRSSEDE